MNSPPPFTVFGDHVSDMKDVPEAMHSLIKRLDIDGILQHVKDIILKPNYVIAEDWHQGNTTSPLVIESVIQYVKAASPRARVTIGEGGFTNETNRSFEINGLPELCKKYGVGLIDFNSDDKVTIQIPGAKALKGNVDIARHAFECDCIISLPALKTHTMAVTTLSMKNFMGTLSYKSIMHSRLHEKIVDLYSYFRAKSPFSIIDGTVGSEGSEIAGNPMNHGLLLASRDFVALDTVGSYLMGQDLAACKYLTIAEARGFGIATMKKITVQGLDVEKNVKHYTPGS
nr:DUF362 domain-containing protein [Candidatus Sigynarchaeota archaeon]